MKTRENTQNPQSSRGTSTLYKRLGVSNHFHTLFLTSNENLTPTSYTFSEFLSANFRKNRKQKSDFEFNAKSRTTAENIAYRTNQLPVGAQVFAPTACNPTIVGLHPIGAKTWACSRTLLKLEVRVKSHRRNAKCWIENARKHAKSRTTAENIAYRTNQLPVRAKEF